MKLRVESVAIPLLDEFVAAHGAQVLERDSEHVTVEVTGNKYQVDLFLDELPAGATVLSLVRSGPLVTSQGPHSLT